MDQRIRSTIKKVVPTPLLRVFRMLPSHLQSIKARLIFELAGTEPAWLDNDKIEFYQQKYLPPPPYGYDPASLAKRGKERAESIMNLIPAKGNNTFLELGCWDGMVSYALQCFGKTTVAIDNRSEGFDERAIRGGVKLLQMDAHHLEFESEMFDVAFSYDSFEHFARPEDVLQEIIRVVRIGGYIYLKFGPLYMSPRGAHLYRQITIPYCHLLFPKVLLQSFANEKGLGTLNFDEGNGYTVESFRKLWIDYSHSLKQIRYYEMPDTSHIDLIEKYPSCFKSKTKVFDNLIISGISVLFQKTKRNVP